LMMCSSLVFAADFSGQWSYRYPDPKYSHSADFSLWQRGSQVYGVWGESGNRGWVGCIKGTIRSGSLFAARCYEDGSFGTENGIVCPVYQPPSDRFDLSGNSLIWYRLNASKKWERYIALKRHGSPGLSGEQALGFDGKWSEECGAVGP
jgi:hypothetical protein